MRFSKSKLKKLRKKRAKQMRMTEQDKKNALNLEAHQIAVKLCRGKVPLVSEVPRSRLPGSFESGKRR